MLVLYIVFAVLLLAAGHMMKSMRWKQLISIYEEIGMMDLLSAISVGQAINMIIPFRVGDLFRAWMVGRKKLDNGYILALATVFTDIFIDTVTVGLAFITLYVLGIHKDSVKPMAVGYGILSLVLIAACALILSLKKYVKLAVRHVAGIFNVRIERRILMVVYTVFASIKDMLKLDNAKRIFFYTAGVWICYFLSYDLFAAFLQRLGYDFTLTGVFKTIFSMSGDALLIECIKAGRDASLAWFALYLFVPLMMIILFVTAYGRIKGRSQTTHKSSRIIPQISEADRLAFLNIYFSGDENRDYFDKYLSINKDINVLQDCSAGSNATTILAMTADSTFYRKYAFGADAEKLYEQVEWLDRHEGLLPLCSILRTYKEDKVCYYDMEYRGTAIGFFQYIHTASVDKSWDVLKRVLDTLRENLYAKTVHEAEAGTIEEYALQKAEKNIEKCERWCRRYYEDLYLDEDVLINGKRYHNIGYYREHFQTGHLLSVFGADKQSDIHGDLTVENIICLQGEEAGWYLIDPNTGNVHESPFLDYAKMLQSLHGKYEFLMMVNDVKVKGNRIEFLFTVSAAYQSLYEKYMAYLWENFTGEEVKSIYYHEAVHWLRLMPYKIQKDPQSAVIFYAGMLMVLGDIDEMFGRE